MNKGKLDTTFDLRGTGKVFSFTMQQQLKSRANRIMFIVLVAVAALLVPIAGLFLGGQSDAPSELSLSVWSASEFLERESIGFDTRYGVQYGYSLIVMIICVFATTYIVRSLVEEKASRLVETLMVSVSAMALLLGKMLAIMAFIFAQLLVLAAVFAISCLVSGQVTDTSFVGDTLASFGVTTDLLKLDFGTAVVVLVSLVLAYLLFSEIAGLAGAGCANVEEADGANMVATMTIMVGFLVASFTTGFASGPLGAILALCPVISAFTLPAYYILGNANWGIVIGSWALSCAMILLLLWLAARVYDRLMMYQGTRLSMGKILRMAGEKGGEAHV